MKHYKKETKVITETKTFTHLIKFTCDLCGEEGIDTTDWFGNLGSYKTDEIEVNVKIKRLKETVYPGGEGDSIKIEIDICPKCFENKLMPWLKLEGATIEEEKFWW